MNRFAKTVTALALAAGLVMAGVAGPALAGKPSSATYDPCSAFEVTIGNGRVTDGLNQWRLRNTGTWDRTYDLNFYLNGSRIGTGEVFIRAGGFVRVSGLTSNPQERISVLPDHYGDPAVHEAGCTVLSGPGAFAGR